MNNKDFKPDSEVAPTANMTNKTNKTKVGSVIWDIISRRRILRRALKYQI